MAMDEQSHDTRWDIHTNRQIAASKGGTIAVTALNSGSWLALLTQAGSLSEVGIGLPIAFWGMGALLGTLLWLFIYHSTLLQWKHDIDRENSKLSARLDRNIKLGISVAVLSLGFFFAGVVALAHAVW